MTSSKCECTTSDNYMSNRELVIKEERSYAIGAKLELNEKEKVLNDSLMKYKYEELDKGFANPETFLASNHFFKAIEKLADSEVFRIIKLIPKGASLHSHDTAMASGEYIYQLTFKENLYGLVKDGTLNLQFFKKDTQQKCACGRIQQDWKPLNELRSDPNFENFLKSRLTLVCDQPELTYPDVNSVWRDFQNLFINLEKLLTYKPVFQEYFYQALKELYEDNVKYVEFRGYLPTVYDLDGKEYNAEEVVGLYCETLRQFELDYPDFYGCHFIFAPHRLVDAEGMNNYVKIYKNIKSKYPDFVMGFDLVGQEDLGEPLVSFIPQLLELKNFGCKFFFHAGETHWNGQTSDVNLIDAVLLNSVRLGHAFSLLKHPLIARMVKEKQIAIEVCPISNQVLKLIDDLRSHPAAPLIANDYPLVIASDDPSFFGSKGLSPDWYITFMALSHRDADLKMLKQLALNSLKYSGLEGADKALVIQKWESDWNDFIETVVVLK